MAGTAVAETRRNGVFGPQNPFYTASALPFQAPPFGKIKDSDYQAAIDAGMTARTEIDAIANNAEAPTFENTSRVRHPYWTSSRRRAAPALRVISRSGVAGS